MAGRRAAGDAARGVGGARRRRRVVQPECGEGASGCSVGIIVGALIQRQRALQPSGGGQLLCGEQLPPGRPCHAPPCEPPPIEAHTKSQLQLEAQAVTAGSTGNSNHRTRTAAPGLPPPPQTTTSCTTPAFGISARGAPGEVPQRPRINAAGAYLLSVVVQQSPCAVFFVVLRCPVAAQRDHLAIVLQQQAPASSCRHLHHTSLLC